MNLMSSAAPCCAGSGSSTAPRSCSRRQRICERSKAKRMEISGLGRLQQPLLALFHPLSALQRPRQGPERLENTSAAPSRASSAAPGSSPAPLWEPRSLPRRCRWCASRSPPSGTCSPTCATPLYRLERPKTARKRLQNGRFGLAQACPGLLLVARNLELFTSICWFATARFSMISRSRTRSSGNSSSTSCMECACRDAAEALQKSL